MYGILVDVTRCTGCEKCVDACIKANNSNYEKAQIDSVAARDGLSANRLSSIIKLENGHFARKSCMHCLEPSCVSACLVGSLTKTPEGAVVYDPSKCIGCRYCMLACPFHIPRYEWDSTHPYVMKCAMCIDRIQDGKLPACVEACPEQAMIFGHRDELLKKARRRIAANPEKYINHVWGEREFGGTAVMYISDVDLGKLDWPKVPASAIPELTEPLISKTPVIAMSVMGGILSINWIIGRRMKLAAERRSQAENLEPEVKKDQDDEQ
ncbi:MAG TPA: 4Fe-4S dicluster domain-containing protein [candidate division Zixibacteria bacterium]|nr:4Fe-4S dicluster domain-containing protein [candidate division Zixibacteria bacterium]